MKTKLLLNSLVVIILIAGCSEDLSHTNPYDLDTPMQTFIDEGYTTLEVDNVFRAADSPYYIDKNLVIRAQLTIEPGTELCFSPGVGMTIEDAYLYQPETYYSALIAVGTADAPIVFKSAGTEEWAGITFSHLSTNNSILKYCRIENGTVTINDDTMTVEDCNFQFSTLEINGSGYGIPGSYYDWGTNVSRPMIRNNLFWGTVNIYAASPFILYNEMGGFINVNYEGANPEIAYNHGSGAINAVGPCELYAHHNTFTEFEFEFLGNVTAKIEYNEFIGGANFQPFYNFERFIFVRTMDRIPPDENILTIHNNNFYGDPGCQFVSLYTSGGTGEGMQTADVDAINNYWGTTDSLTIEAAIYDKVDDGSLGRVNFIPFLNSPVQSAGSGW